MVTDLWEEDWHNDYTIQQSRDILVDNYTENVDLLPKLKDNEGKPQPAFGSLYIAHPTLSLSDNHVVYIMGKVSRQDKKALVLSVDMRIPKLQGAAVFDAERMGGITFNYTYTQSRIPKYFNPGVNGHLKRPGKFHMRYPCKLRDRFTVMYGTGSNKGAEDDDIMALD
uniref:Uncharacterized protein n=1 Tax=Arundo donax TaxID=35708 RepID=A0A0A8XTB2_ARUDO